MPTQPAIMVGTAARDTGCAGMGPTVRLTRAGSTSVGATFIALMSHIAAGGAIPGLLGIAVPLLISFSLCSVLAGVRLHWVRLSASVAVSQLLFHTLFVLGAGSSTGASTSVGHHVDSATAMTMLAGRSMTGHGMHTSMTMVAAHLCAAVITVLALSRGEDVATRLTQVMSRVVALVLPTLPAGTPAALRSHAVPARWATDHKPHVLLLARGGLSRRGPPVLAAFATHR